MKHLPNVISILRIAGSIGLLFCDVIEWQFWVLYASCGISDMVDGWLARKLQAETKAGAVFDSVANKLTGLLLFLAVPAVFFVCDSCFHRGGYSHLRRRAGRALYQNEASFLTCFLDLSE